MVDKKQLEAVYKQACRANFRGQVWNRKHEPKVYEVLNSTGILDSYIINCYDVLHTQGKDYLVEDITDFAREKGVQV